MKIFELGIDERLVVDVESLAEGVGCSPSEIISGILVDWFARQDSWIHAEGYVPRALVELADVPDISEKYQMLRAIYDQEHLREWEQATVISASYGAPLDEKQQAYIDGLHERKERLQTSLAKLQEYKTAGLVPLDFYGPSSSAVGYCEQYLDGKIDRARLDHILSNYKKERK